MQKFGIITVFLLLTALPGLSQTSYDVPIDGGNLYFKTFGSGLPVLIVNGGPGMDSNGFEGLASTLSDSQMTIIFDQRGTGKSALKTISSESINMDLMVEDMEIIRKQLDIQQWVILGHSFGGMLASYYASKYPDHTLGLIHSSSGGINLDLMNSLNISSNLTPVQRDSLQYWERQISLGDTSMHARENRAKYFAYAYLHDDNKVSKIAHRFTEGNMNINRIVIRDMMSFNFDCSEALSDYEKPVLIIQGKYDIIPFSLAENMHNLFKNSRLLILQETGHYGWIEEPEKYYSAINTYLSEIEN